jgi:hypothetical protein
MWGGVSLGLGGGFVRGIMSMRRGRSVLDSLTFWLCLQVDEVANERVDVARNLSVGLFLLSSRFWDKIFWIIVGNVGNLSNPFVRLCQPD